MSLAFKKPSDRDWGLKPNEKVDKEIIDVLSTVFIVKLTDMTYYNAIQWKKAGEYYTADWGVYNINLWPTHFKIINNLNNESFELKENNVQLDALRDLLELQYKSNIYESMYITLAEDIERINKINASSTI